MEEIVPIIIVSVRSLSNSIRKRFTVCPDGLDDLECFVLQDILTASGGGLSLPDALPEEGEILERGNALYAYDRVEAAYELAHRLGYELRFVPEEKIVPTPEWVDRMRDCPYHNCMQGFGSPKIRRSAPGLGEAYRHLLAGL